MPRVAVGLSGGVDSAIGGLILRDLGYEVVGVHLYCWPPRSEYVRSNAPSDLVNHVIPKFVRDRSMLKQVQHDNLGRGSCEEETLRREWIRKNGCRADEDEQLALKTALELGIKFVKLDFSEEYNKKVVDYFYAEYEAGRTPNPDVLCNSEIKFGLFLDWALENNFDYIATGHYARVTPPTPPLKLRGGTGELFTMTIPRDKHKDQTYFLWKLTQKELKHILFPLGNLLKSEVREIANKNNLSVANRKDSQGICFIGNVEAREFLARRLKEKPGIVRDTKGNVIGEHSGVWFYTIGQRGGWRLSAKSQKLEKSKNQMGDVTPIYYVISKNAARNELVVGIDSEAKKGVFEIREVNGEFGGKMYVRIRHTGELIPCVVNGNRVVMSVAQKGVAPGQSAVFYREQRTENREQLEMMMVGGGVIV